MNELQAPSKIGTDELKEVILLVGDATGLLMGVANGLDLTDVAQLLKVAKDVPAVLKDAMKIIPAYVDLDDAERADLVDFVAKNVKIPTSGTVESVLQNMLDLLIAASKFFSLYA